MRSRACPGSCMTSPASRRVPSSGSRPDLALTGIGKQLVPFFNGIDHGIAALTPNRGALSLNWGQGNEERGENLWKIPF
jgi:hypothetical protein